MDKIKLKNMLRPLVKELVKESLFSEKGILSGIIQECVQGLTKEIIVEKKIVPNLPVLREARQLEIDQEDDNEDTGLAQEVLRKRSQLAREELEKQKKMMRASGFADMFKNITPVEAGNTLTESNTGEDAVLSQAIAGPLRGVHGKGVDISGLMAAAGGSQIWKNGIKKG